MAAVTFLTVSTHSSTLRASGGPWQADWVTPDDWSCHHAGLSVVSSQASASEAALRKWRWAAVKTY